jgi:hypothetical protein
MKPHVRDVRLPMLPLLGYRPTQAALVASCVVALAISGCANTMSSPNDESAGVPTVEVPDATGEDGADAQSELEGEGFTVTLDPDDSRDPAGCTVEDQDPVGGSDSAEGDEVIITLDCRQVDWENREGDNWDAFTASFSDGFNDGCATLFDLSPDGSLFDDTDYEYSDIDCRSLEPSDPDSAYVAEVSGDVPDDPEGQGYDAGFEDGCNAVFEDNSVFELYHGQDAYTADDCLAEQPSTATPPRPSRSGGKSSGLTVAAYRVPQSVWQNYSDTKKLALAKLFIQSNPSDCANPHLAHKTSYDTSILAVSLGRACR